LRVGRLEAKTAFRAAPSAQALRWPRPGQGARRVSAADGTQRADRVAGFLCAFSLALSGIAVVRNPGLLATAAILVALVAVVMTRAHRTLAAVSVAVAAAAFLVGMTIAVLTGGSLY
jgi:hypothetical protein